MALDLTTVDEFGRPWNFCDEDCRQRAEELIEFLKPDLLIGGPPCGPFSQIQFLNQTKCDPAEMLRKVQEGREHVRFCCKLYLKQIERKKFFCMSILLVRLHGMRKTLRRWSSSRRSRKAQGTCVSKG